MNRIRGKDASGDALRGGKYKTRRARRSVKGSEARKMCSNVKHITVVTAVSGWAVKSHNVTLRAGLFWMGYTDILSHSNSWEVG